MADSTDQAQAAVITALAELAEQYPSVKTELRLCLRRVRHRLNNPDRLIILRAIQQGYNCMDDIVTATSISKPTVHRWLQLFLQEKLIYTTETIRDASTHKKILFWLRES